MYFRIMNFSTMKNLTASNKKLMQYAASAAAFLMVNEASATIVYTDLDPDGIIGGEGAEIILDINADGNDDFTFIVYSQSGTITYYGSPISYDIRVAGAQALDNNEFVGSLVTVSGYTNVYIPILAPGEGINDEDNFEGGYGSLAIIVNASLYGFPVYTFEGGAWLDTDMEFMGFRLSIDKDYFYGWMRISVNDEANQLTIHDYAYEDEANKAIFTGSTASAIINNPLTNTEIFTAGQDLIVNLPNGISTAVDLELFDLEGKLVLQISQISGSTKVNCEGFAGGNYIVRLTDHNLSYNKQVHIAN